MPKPPYVLAVDLGTSACKTAIVSLAGEVLQWESEPVKTFFLPGGGAEQDPGDWWNALVKTATKLMASGVVPREQVAAICCSTQGEGTVAVDEQGHHLMNAILWMDARGAEHLKEITQGFIRVAGVDALKLLRWLRLSGGIPSATGKDPAAHMLFIKREFPEIYEKTYKFLNVLDYMNLRLTGRFVATYDSILTSWVTDNSDPDKVVYSEALIRGSGIAASKFPELVKSTDVLGTVDSSFAQAVGLSPDTAVVAGAIDTSAAAVGSGAVEDFEAHLYVGTSSWLAAHVPFKKTDVRFSIASVPCAVPSRYLMVALQATACGNLTFLRDKILYHKDELSQDETQSDFYASINEITERTPPGSNGVIYAPWIYGERCPVEDQFARAAIYNLSLSNTREDIIRAVLEGVAMNTRWLLKPAERFLGRKIEAINIIGGGAMSDIWCQIFADVLHRPLRRAKDPIQANVRGAAFIAGMGLGRLTPRDIARDMVYPHTYWPHKNTQALYTRLFREFTAIYRQNRLIFRRLNESSVLQTKEG